MDRYLKNRRIYSGPNSDIYQAVNIENNEIIALKIVDIDFSVKPHNIKQEIKILSDLHHSNILPFIETFKMSDDVVIVTPYYEFDLMSLFKQHLKKSIRFNFEDPLNNTIVYKNQFPLERIRDIFCGMARALSYLHNKTGIIHRDIKPSNIFFKKLDSEPVLGDFGIAYPSRNPPADEPIQEKCLDIATGIYKPPEVCFGVSSYGFEVDIWSLGIVLLLLYSTDGKSIIEEEGNDLALINSLFNNFGTPSLHESDALYWPEMQSDKYHFKDFSFNKRPRRPLRELLPRCQDQTVLDLFNKMMVYERKNRITADSLYKSLS